MAFVNTSFAFVQHSLQLDNAYLAYPHANGFADLGISIVVGVRSGKIWSLRKVNLDTGRETFLCEYPESRLMDQALWFDVSLESNCLYYAVDGILFEIDLSRPREPRQIWQIRGRETTPGLCSVTHAGDKLAFIETQSGVQSLLILDLRKNCVQTKIALPAPTVSQNSPIFNPVAWNHVQFSPFDSNWIGFCNNALSHRIPDRIWAWHTSLAPNGKCLLDHRLGGTTEKIYTGHERWSHHDLSIVTCAFMTSPDRESAGLWEVFPDGKPPRQILRHGRIFHCDISRDGEFLVADTFGPHNGPPIECETWEEDISDILLVDRESGEYELIARSHVGPRRSTPPHFPYHPHHAHPVFHPEGDFVFYNDYDHWAGRCQVRAVQVNRRNSSTKAVVTKAVVSREINDEVFA